jgi:hypothetical protein
MNCREWQQEFNRLTRDEEWREIPPAMTGHVEECPRCGRQLEAFLILSGRKTREAEISPWLVDRVDARVRSGIAKAQRKRRGRTRLVPAGAAMLMLLIFAAGAGLLRSPFSPLSPAVSEQSGAVVVRFVLEAPAAAEVAVVGDWNGWDPQADRLARTDDGVWEVEIPLVPEQEYRYQFLIDGEEWMADPNSILQVEDGFGSVNSVLDI